MQLNRLRQAWLDYLYEIANLPTLIMEEPASMAQTTLTDDEIANLAESWAKSTRLRIYKHLNNMGCTVSGIDTAIDRALKEEKANG